jgi:hypothetical protein
VPDVVFAETASNEVRFSLWPQNKVIEQCGEDLVLGVWVARFFSVEWRVNGGGMGRVEAMLDAARAVSD